jgi:hypothetical protein
MKHTPPTQMSIVAAILADNQPEKKTPSLLTRANILLTSILGEHAGHARLADIQYGSGDIPVGAKIIFEVDEISLRFVPGGSPDDDFFQLRFLHAPAARLIGIRTQAGLRYALSENIAFLCRLFDEVTGDVLMEME